MIALLNQRSSTKGKIQRYDAMLEQGNASQAAHGESFDGGDVWQYDSEVSYPFGYGLEGSTFEEKILDLSIDWTGETDSTATVRVTNTGDTAAKHVVQLYVSVPYTARRDGRSYHSFQRKGHDEL